VTSVIAEGAEKDRLPRQAAASALVRFLLEQDAGNAQVMSAWLGEWTPQVLNACDAIAPLFEALDVPVQSFAKARATVFEEWRRLLQEGGLDAATGAP
jgi:ABC-type Fe3+ transport system substrate-binding protein